MNATPTTRLNENRSAYQALAKRLDTLPNGFPATPDEADLRLLAYLFQPEEAQLAAQLRISLETPGQIAARMESDPRLTRQQLKDLARRGLIAVGRAQGGLGYGLMPFVVGFYEMQNQTIDEELARLFEAYYRQSAPQIMQTQPSVHRVIPVNESVAAGIEIRPYESAAEILQRAHAWGVVDCICRKQKALIGQPCKHPVEETCMVFSDTPGVFDQASEVKALTLAEALDTLQHASQIGLVHTVGNTRQGIDYICNCCTCSCGVLRGLAEMGLANVVARSAFLLQIDDGRCNTCGTCADACQFGALTIEMTAVVNSMRCVGCGVCVLTCPEQALSLVRRPEEESIPETQAEWRQLRADRRGIDLREIL